MLSVYPVSQYKDSLGGIIACSSYLVQQDLFPANLSEAARATPLLVVHGDADAMVPLWYAEQGVKHLVEACALTTLEKLVVRGMAHECPPPVTAKVCVLVVRRFVVLVVASNRRRSSGLADCRVRREAIFCRSKAKGGGRRRRRQQQRQQEQQQRQQQRQRPEFDDAFAFAARDVGARHQVGAGSARRRVRRLLGEERPRAAARRFAPK